MTGLVISIFAERNFVDSLFEFVSALTTTGQYRNNYSQSGLISKTFLIINTVAGRFEIVCILYIFFGAIRKI
jgi:trk system potassium uptake protein TrkH